MHANFLRWQFLVTSLSYVKSYYKKKFGQYLLDRKGSRGTKTLQWSEASRWWLLMKYETMKKALSCTSLIRSSRNNHCSFCSSMFCIIDCDLSTRYLKVEQTKLRWVITSLMIKTYSRISVNIMHGKA